MKYFVFLLLFLFTLGCNKSTFSFSEFWEKHPKLAEIATDTTRYKVQIILTDVDNNRTYSYNQNKEYFYPASTVKLASAIVTLEKVHQEGRFSSTDSLLFQGDSAKTTLRTEIEKIFATSDNDAFNKLLWITGNRAINSCMNLGKGTTIVQHSLQSDSDLVPAFYTVFTKDEQLKLPTLAIANNTIYNPMRTKKFKGKAHYVSDSLVYAPMDFSSKNVYSLEAVHHTLERLFVPKSVADSLRFRLEKSDAQFLKNSMAKYPREFGLDAREYPDNYVKFLLLGGNKNDGIKNYLVHNKVGFAYGQVTDAAYIMNKNTKRSFIVSATIYTNQNQILNDDTYEYEEIAIPFLGNLGMALISELESQ